MPEVVRHSSTARWALALTLLIALVGSQVFFDRNAPQGHDIPLSTLSPDVVRAADLGLHGAAASLLWLRVVQNVGMYVLQSPKTMSSDMQAVVELDPKFSYPYSFAVLMIPGIDRSQTPQALAIGERGMAENLGDWRIPYYLGFTYHFVLHDPKNALVYMTQTAHTPGVPEGIKVSALNYGSQTKVEEQTREIWTAIRDNATDDVTRQQAQDNLDHLAIIDGLKAAVAAYKARYGTFPTRLDALVTSGIIPAIPQDPFGITFGILHDNGELTFSLGK